MCQTRVEIQKALVNINGGPQMHDGGMMGDQDAYGGDDMVP